jgi:hypothetical protein
MANAWLFRWGSCGSILLFTLVPNQLFWKPWRLPDAGVKVILFLTLVSNQLFWKTWLMPDCSNVDHARPFYYLPLCPISCFGEHGWCQTVKVGLMWIHSIAYPCIQSAVLENMADARLLRWGSCGSILLLTLVSNQLFWRTWLMPDC